MADNSQIQEILPELDSDEIEQMCLTIQRQESLSRTAYVEHFGRDPVITFAWGHNGNKPLSVEACEMIFTDDMKDAIGDLRANKGELLQKIDRRAIPILINMCFNMGVSRLLGFKKMFQALENGDYLEAAEQMKDSLWFRQVKTRGVFLYDAMKSIPTN